MTGPGCLAAWAIAEFDGARTFCFRPRGGHSRAVSDDHSRQTVLPRIWADCLRDFSFSPMAFTLSTTTHAHLLSRATISIALLLYFLAKDKKSLGHWALTGLATGISFCVRPIETTFILFPLPVRGGAGVFKESPALKPALGLLLGCVVPLALFFLYNYAVTGNAFFPPRFSAEGPRDRNARGSSGTGSARTRVITFSCWPSGFSARLGFYWLALAFVGQVYQAPRPGGRSDAAAGLFHDNQGLHAVGPIHYSECVVPLTSSRFTAWSA